MHEAALKLMMNVITTESKSPVDVSLVALPQLPELEQAWRALEGVSRPSFFTSWSWIGCWLETLPVEYRPMLLRARRDGRDIGMALLARSDRRRFGLRFCDCWHLNATGVADYDSLTIEHNGFLLDSGHQQVAAAAMLEYWERISAHASELILPGQAGHGLPAALTSLLIRSDWVRTSYGVDLSAVRAKKGDYLSLLSSNTRSQIRRSIKEYEKIGQLQLTQASHTAQAQLFLGRLAELHQRHWIARGEPGAFGSEYFRRFHERLIERNFARGEIQLLRISAGDRDLAYLYSFVRDGRIYFYQSGFDYDLIEKHSRPGLVAHVLSVQHNAQLGYMIYDFMAGDSRYKLNLATLNELMTWSTLRKPAWRFQLEQAAIRHRRRRNAEINTTSTTSDQGDVAAD